MGGHGQQQHCFSMPAASLLSSFGLIGINLKGVFVGIKVLEAFERESQVALWP